MLRAELGLAEQDGGVRIARVWALGSAAGVLAPGDILLTVDGRKVEQDGLYDRPGTGRMPFHGVFSAGHHPGDVVDLGILRGGTRQMVKMTLKASAESTRLVPWFAPEDRASAYVIEGGLVFETLSGEYLRSFGNDWTAKVSQQFLDAWLDLRTISTLQRPSVVVLTRVLADPATLGYERLHDLVVEATNGTPAAGLDRRLRGFAHPDGPFDFVTLAPGQGCAASSSTPRRRRRPTHG